MKWINKKGESVETNDNPQTIENCKARGWEQAEEPKAASPKKKQAKPKAED